MTPFDLIKRLWPDGVPLADYHLLERAIAASVDNPKGRVGKLTTKVRQLLRRKSMTAKEICQAVGCSRSSVYVLIRRAGGKASAPRGANLRGEIIRYSVKR